MEHRRRPLWDTVPFDQEERKTLEEADRDPNALTTSTGIDQKLGLFSTCCIILNRVIGTGIFSTPANILNATGSPGASLLLWAAGAVISWAGLMVYMEFGLSIPRYTKDDVTEVVPRSGGEKDYLEYVYRVPKYLSTCVYGIVFIVLGNTAGNAISFAEHALIAHGSENPPDWCINGIAIGAITVACLLHGSWRAGGIWVNNIFATIKCLLLLVFIVGGLAFSAGGKGPSRSNLDPSVSFELNSTIVLSPDRYSTAPLSDAGRMYGYSQAILLIIFAYGGFENANYVLGEIDRPKRTYKWASMTSMALISILYMLVNIVYYLVLDLDDFRSENSKLGLRFFAEVVGVQNKKAQSAVASFIAFSSFGNIIVVTFVSSRVKQEIAKEGVLPYSRIIASDMRTPFSWLREALSSSNESSRGENSPIPALCLHWVFSLILIVASGTDTYLILLLLRSYAIHVTVGFFLGIGLLYLHWKPGSNWKVNRGFKPFGSWMWALIFAVVNLFLICVPWIKPPYEFEKLLLESTEFFVYPTIAVGLMSFGVIYWIGFAKLYPKYYKKVLTVKRIPFVRDGVQVCEAVFFNWQIPDTGDDRESEVEPENNKELN